jgi:hypothetical protein
LILGKKRIETNPGKNPGLRAKSALDTYVGGERLEWLDMGEERAGGMRIIMKIEV